MIDSGGGAEAPPPLAGSPGPGGFLRGLEDRGVGLVGDLGEEQEVVSAEGRSALPLIAVFVEAVEGHVEPRPIPGRVSPDGGLNRSRSYFCDWFLICHDSYLLLKGICVFSFTRSRRKNQTPEEIRPLPAAGKGGFAARVTAYLAREVLGLTRAGVG